VDFLPPFLISSKILQKYYRCRIRSAENNSKNKCQNLGKLSLKKNLTQEKYDKKLAFAKPRFLKKYIIWQMRAYSYSSVPWRHLTQLEFSK
jgi:hypothetical protein